MARIAVGGFQHETNTFAPIKADWGCFLRTDSFPAFRAGNEFFAAAVDYPWPIRGALEALNEHEIVPLAWAGATPSAHVTDDAFERISAAICEPLAVAGTIDGLYLDLHGAAVSESLEDAEGELLRSVREIVGPEMPIAISLDLHANLTEAMVELADIVDIYRTYPHVDMPATGARTVKHLLDFIDRPHRRAKALRRPPFLIPINWGCTLIEPARTLYSMLAANDEDNSLQPALAMGFPQADIAECGPAVVVTGTSQDKVDALADRLLNDLVESEAVFCGKLWPPQEAISEAQRLVAKPGKGPVVIADTQDNPGGGGPGDTTGLLEALLQARPVNAAIGILIDPASAALAHEIGIGQTGCFSLGGKSGMVGHRPLEVTAKVVQLGDGRFVGTGPMARGGRFDMGPMALLEVAGVRIAIGSICAQTLDQAQLRHLGIEPEKLSILILKSSVHFRNDFQDLAREVLVAVAPGPVTADLTELPYRQLRTGVRIMPRLNGSTM